MTCNICHKEYSASCDYKQGRCPGHPPLIDLGKIMNQPDPKLHQRISFVKSALRIVAGCSLAAGNLFFAGTMIVVAEMLGIIEELV